MNFTVFIIFLITKLKETLTDFSNNFNKAF
jgi:hypothetical protein